MRTLVEQQTTANIIWSFVIWIHKIWPAIYRKQNVWFGDFTLLHHYPEEPLLQPSVCMGRKTIIWCYTHTALYWSDSEVPPRSTATQLQFLPQDHFLHWNHQCSSSSLIGWVCFSAAAAVFCSSPGQVRLLWPYCPPHCLLTSPCTWQRTPV